MDPSAEGPCCRYSEAARFFPAFATDFPDRQLLPPMSEDLFAPLELRDTEVPNRVMVSPMCQ